ncbi:hypothetical protein LJR030_001877 [Rhizobium sp. LjRoot30]|uniref:hypothetical protein n=1 Tax=Rhizobium sp. LjRoot30 TaxID=3342320 RepID=UPI003ECE1E70
MAFTSDELKRNPDFIRALIYLAVNLGDFHRENPRLCRTLVSHQRWLMGQAAYMLFLEADPAQPGTGLTSARLKDLILQTGCASRNTVLAFVEEMLSYRFVRYYPEDEGRRSRRLEPTEVVRAGMFHWLLANLAALDQLDGGNRAQTMMMDRDLADPTHRRAVRMCLESQAWCEPPRRVAMFLWTEAGGLVMDELISRIELSKQIDGRMNIGRVDARALAEKFMMSRTHLQRLLKKAASDGCIGWYDAKRGGDMWFSSEFLTEYSAWQAIKFAAIDQAFKAALTGVEPEYTDEEADSMPENATRLFQACGLT